MTRGPSRIVLVILTILGAVTALPALLVSALPAQAQPTSSTEETAAPQFLKLSLDSVSPGTVTLESEPVLTVTGTVTNIGDRGVDEVAVRVQRAHAVADPSELRTSLKLDQASYDHPTPFEDIAERLEPGRRQQFTLSVPLRNGAGTSLDIAEPGVYPLLLNVNGTPDYGGQARLDDARFLLPVLGLPAAADGSAPPLPPPANPPVATTVLWPLADRPRMVAGQTGDLDRTVELTDDELAASLGRGGRLDELVGALESVFGDKRDSGNNPADPASAVCLAVDPDLLLTVQAMTGDYRVLASPSDPAGATRPGTGTDAAKRWLDRLRGLASSMCTVALPFAQVDISALAAANDPALTHRALEAPATIVDSILNTRSVRGVSLPDAGSLDPNAAQLLKSRGFGTAVVANNAIAPEGGSGDPYAPVPDLVRLPSVSGISLPPEAATAPEAVPTEAPVPGQGPADTEASAESRPPAQSPLPGSGGASTGDPALRAATFDIWPAAALAGIGSNPPTPAYVPQEARYPVTNDSRSARLQDALGAVSWEALHADPKRPRSQLIMPPQQWGANRDEAAALLRQIDLLAKHKLVNPRPFPDLLRQEPDPAPYQPTPLADAGIEAVPDHFAVPARDQSHRITQLQQAMVEVPETQPTPRSFLNPLRDDLVRALSLSDRHGGPTAQAEVFAQHRIEKATASVDEIYRSVTVLPPGGVYTLASESSPLLLVARNDLPISVRIRFRIDAPPETKITDIGEQLLPPRGTRSFQIPSEVSDSRNLVVPISLSTPDGVPLGHSTSISVRSNAYGQILAIITACAAALLFLLAGRRLWRRFHGERDPADKGVDPGVRRRVIRVGRARRRKAGRAPAE